MSRRDTIIIAVLLNAGLLIVLFATSLKSDSSPREMSSVAVAPALRVEESAIPTPTIVPAQGSLQLKAAPVGDEVDQAARQYTPPLLTTSEGSQVNFAADLQAITGLDTALPPTGVAASQTSPIAEPAPAFREVTVKKGDVLERIARHNHVTVDEIMKANGLTSARLKIGQVLKIPSKEAARKEAAAPAQVASAPKASEDPKYYTVKNGDNPWTIAVKNHIKVEDLLRLNNLDEEKARRLKPGDKIRIK